MNKALYVAAIKSLREEADYQSEEEGGGDIGLSDMLYDIASIMEEALTEGVSEKDWRLEVQ